MKLAIGIVLIITLAVFIIGNCLAKSANEARQTMNERTAWTAYE